MCLSKHLKLSHMLILDYPIYLKHLRSLDLDNVLGMAPERQRTEVSSGTKLDKLAITTKKFKDLAGWAGVIELVSDFKLKVTEMKAQAGHELLLLESCHRLRRLEVVVNNPAFLNIVISLA